MTSSEYESEHINIPLVEEAGLVVTRYFKPDLFGGQEHFTVLVSDNGDDDMSPYISRFRTLCKKNNCEQPSNKYAFSIGIQGCWKIFAGCYADRATIEEYLKAIFEEELREIQYKREEYDTIEKQINEFKLP